MTVIIEKLIALEPFEAEMLKKKNNEKFNLTCSFVTQEEDKELFDFCEKHYSNSRAVNSQGEAGFYIEKIDCHHVAGVGFTLITRKLSDLRRKLLPESFHSVKSFLVKHDLREFYNVY